MHIIWLGVQQDYYVVGRVYCAFIKSLVLYDLYRNYDKYSENNITFVIYEFSFLRQEQSLSFTFIN